MSDHDSEESVDSFFDRLKKSPFFYPIIIVGVIIIGLGTFKDSLESLMDWNGDDEPTEIVDPRNGPKPPPSKGKAAPAPGRNMLEYRSTTGECWVAEYRPPTSDFQSSRVGDLKSRTVVDELGIQDWDGGPVYVGVQAGQFVLRPKGGGPPERGPSFRFVDCKGNEMTARLEGRDLVVTPR